MQQRLAAGRPSHDLTPRRRAGVEVDVVVGLEPPERQRRRRPPVEAQARACAGGDLVEERGVRLPSAPRAVERATGRGRRPGASVSMAQSSSTSLRYAAASSSASSSAGSAISTTKIQPAPYGIWLICSGASIERLVDLDDGAGDAASRSPTPTSSTRPRRRSRRAITVEPDVGEVDVDHVAERVLREIGDADPSADAVDRHPLVLGRCTGARRETAWAQIVARAVSAGSGGCAATYSCVSRRASLVAARLRPHVRRAPPRGRAGRAPTDRRSMIFTPSMSSTWRFADLLDDLAHHRALAFPRRDDRLVRHVDRRQRRAHLDSGRSTWREQVEQLHQRDGGVVGREEVGPDAPAVGRAGERDAAHRRRLHEARARQLRADDRVVTEDLLDRAGDVDRHRDARVGNRLGDERADREEQLFGLEDVAGVVDDGGELTVGIDHEPEVAPRCADELGNPQHVRIAGSRS